MIELAALAFASGGVGAYVADRIAQRRIDSAYKSGFADACSLAPDDAEEQEPTAYIGKDLDG